MAPSNNGLSRLPAVLVGIAAAVAAYLPVFGAWEAARRSLTPIRHAEEVMGRGLEAMLIAGPVGALLIGILVGFASYRTGKPATLAVALLVLAGAIGGTALLARRLMG